ncbi:MAG TPA: CopG family transcriptional regulator [Phycisphaerae bacterium]|nr:CopG family transcriptional regulator [Phycisphaerae bacterium]
MKTNTCKLPEKLDAELETAARQEGISKSQIVRWALEAYVGKKRARKSLRAFDLVKDLSGSLKGPADLLTHARYMEDFGARAFGYRRHRAIGGVSGRK